jgi:hypothetical protein
MKNIEKLKAEFGKLTVSGFYFFILHNSYAAVSEWR